MSLFNRNLIKKGLAALPTISSIDGKYLRTHYWGAKRVIGVLDRAAE